MLRTEKADSAGALSVSVRVICFFLIVIIPAGFIPVLLCPACLPLKQMRAHPLAGTGLS
ncbi:hypothetical protein K2A10_004714 [Salmonella enterica subsp. enterica serovar Concord]|nr:hypothetical protein [Salmonella enterica subsp. enterica serovar Concord]